MVWYGYGWWWWWIAFIVVFFALPLGYGWGYRGWGPWYRRRGRTMASYDASQERLPEDAGWGWGGTFLWFVLVVWFIWLVVALSWGGTGGTPY